MTVKKDYKNDFTSSYYRDAAKNSLLTMEEEYELSRKIASGDKAALNKLIEANLRLVIKIAHEYKNNGFNTLEDLIQEGNIGLIIAAKRYDYKKETRFSTYAVWWIRQSILRAIITTKRFIRLPQRKEELLIKINRMNTYLSQTLGREPSSQEVAEKLGLSEAHIREIMTMAYSVIPLESFYDEEGNEMNIIDTFEDETYSPIVELMRISHQEQILTLLEVLREKEKQVIVQRMDSNESQRSLKKIGIEMGISPETVRQMEKRAIAKLRMEYRYSDFMTA